MIIYLYLLVLGEVHTFESYRECVALKIYSKPELYMVPDKTRLHAKHDLNISVSQSVAAVLDISINTVMLIFAANQYIETLTL
jgi:hypothetical protein